MNCKLNFKRGYHITKQSWGQHEMLKGSKIAMNEKKQAAEDNNDRIERLKKIHAEWKEKQWPNDLFEIEDYIVDDPVDLNLERRW